MPWNLLPIRRGLVTLCCCLAFIAVAFRVPFFPLFAMSLPADMNFMEPLLHGGDIVLVHRFAYREARPANGDVIIYWNSHKDLSYIGVATPCATGTDPAAGLFGEWFSASPGTGSICVRHARAEAPPHPGLNPVPLTAVRGQAVFVCWPPSSWGKVKNG